MGGNGMEMLLWIAVGLVLAGVLAWNLPKLWAKALSKGSEIENKVTDAVKDKVDDIRKD
jgi:hypothetical protein